METQQQYLNRAQSYILALLCKNITMVAGRGIGRITAELVIDYLQHQGHVSYQGVKRLTQK